jgi:hypothetical protein
VLSFSAVPIQFHIGSEEVPYITQNWVIRYIIQLHFRKHFFYHECQYHIKKLWHIISNYETSYFHTHFRKSEMTHAYSNRFWVCWLGVWIFVARAIHRLFLFKVQNAILNFYKILNNKSRCRQYCILITCKVLIWNTLYSRLHKTEVVKVCCYMWLVRTTSLILYPGVELH